ncbi:MAG: folylpolyglutamate synthase/dihydrofolate synthase family protein [Acidobacteriota bacterium]
MDFNEALAYLNSVEKFGIRLGLSNIEFLLKSFDNPQNKFKTIHIGGTNGKGSVCSMVFEALKRAGYKTGLYTSPHLIDITERIRVNDDCISKAEFSEIISEIRKKINSSIFKKNLVGHPTYFEILTLAGFLFFEKEKIDVGVIEVGLGGRFDATNVIYPEISAITNVSYDHENYLGKKLSEIAFEKAGIIKARIPVVYGGKKGIAYFTIKEKAIEVKSPLIWVNSKENIFGINRLENRYLFSLKTPRFSYEFTPSLQGRHQGENALVSIFILEELRKKGWNISPEQIKNSIENTKWEGRLETINTNPQIILDGAHNPHAIKRLKEYIEENIDKKIALIFGAMRDKDIFRMAKLMFPMSERVILTKANTERAAEPLFIMKISKAKTKNIEIMDNVKLAIEKLTKECSDDFVILITGSLYLVGEAKKALIECNKIK